VRISRSEEETIGVVNVTGVEEKSVQWRHPLAQKLQAWMGRLVRSP
jgi:hypothetical protein